ncbi:DsrH/TusB family sulfur metabolism protein [Alteromonas sp. 1_MG-2023]|uniref:DsrH/TusB family sulfur metabolism protein n=1 Tax=Alteromonas sp. 1_MG-2023 TaxID=3062669 RepID=UPI0026E15949|nr:DsrH/TusB family sulfur metabolism protein [Alteromonas sp. 1_MG-2023]MDO6569054.1 DsrH/TusB family sulfur metabolism protein [Alteromonas sp. 1_MG-2023]
MLFIVKSYPLNAVAIKTLQQAFRSADSDQALVLIDDGVYYAQQTDDGLLSVLANTSDANEDVHSATTQLFALQEDMALRGVVPRISNGANQGFSEDNKTSIKPISMDECVMLTGTFYPVVCL